jgi:ornithine--oxo-acid transaminase
MGFDLDGLLDARHGDGFDLHRRHMNPQIPRVLSTIGFDAVYDRAEGAYLYDDTGRRYLDFMSGFGVFGIGHNHPTVRRALHAALDRDLADMLQMDTPLLAGLLAERLLEKAPGLDRVYFSSSGTEAVEAALKFARFATGRPRVVYCDHAFHGLTTGSLSVNGGAEFRKGFAPLLPDTVIPFGDLEALQRELRRGGVAAFVVEPVQGKGVQVAPPGFLAGAHQLLHDHGALLICDEVQTGLGRTGRFFAYEHDGVDPDIVAIAKTLSGGFVPVAATLSKGWIFDKVYSSMNRALVHASTYSGNALAMVAGLATLSVIDDEGLVNHADRVGAVLRDDLRSLAERYELLSDVRGRGLMIGFEFGPPRSARLRGGWDVLHRTRKGLFAQAVVGALYHRHGILSQVAADHAEIVKILPPLMIGDDEVTQFVEGFTDVMDDAHRSRGLAWNLGRTMLTNVFNARQRVRP